MKKSVKNPFKRHLKHWLIGLSLSLTPVLHSAEIISVQQLQSQATSVLGSSVVPKKQVSLSAQIPGRVLSLNGKVGTAFKGGDVIAEIDSSALLAQRNSVIAQISAAQSNLHNAHTQLNREITSPKRDDISAMPGFGFPAMMDQYMTRPMADMIGSSDSSVNKHADLVSSQTTVAQANFALQQAMAQLQSIDSSLRDAKTIAPFNGIILEKKVEVGDTLQAGQPLVSFGYVQELQLRADVPSALVVSLKEGMEVAAKIAGTASIKASVAEIHPVADPDRHTVVVKFDLPADTQASPGMYAEVMLPLGKRQNSQQLLIPASALLKGRSLPSVLLVQGKVSTLRLVRLGTTQNNGLLEVVSGLKADDKIVNNPPAGVSSGWLPQ